MAETNAYGPRVCLVADMEAYSGLTISGQVRQWDTLDLLYGTAARTAGLDPASWYRQAAGDGILAVLPEGADGAQVLADFTGELGAALDR
jgi:hypothetical protein